MGRSDLYRLGQAWDAINRQKKPLVEIRDRRGEAPCGECHLSPDEVCDICGASFAPSPSTPGERS